MPVCPGCGSSYEESFKFCPQCGRAKPEEKKVVFSVEVKSQARDFDCPLCGDASAVQKVSAIVGGGTVEGHGSHTSNGTSNVYSEKSGEHVASAYSVNTSSSYQKSQSILAKKLSMPDPPAVPERETYAAGGGCSWALGVVVFIGVSALLLGNDSYSSLFHTAGGGLLACGLWIVIAGLAAGLGVGAADYMSNEMNDTKSKFAAAMEDYQREMRVYQGIKAQWDQLYYCHKHDVVYTSRLREPAPVDQAIGMCFLWSNKDNA